ncbi:hypothetical protein EWM66_14140 [Escherichia coli O157:H7]|nr:hypothetical protein UQ23_27220 [Escherichia coli]QDG05535.1 hypothetical protein EWM66_14140 [Escherichia coli O157:H7]
MLPSETMIWQPEFTDKTLSRKPGAVQYFSDESQYWLFFYYAAGAFISSIRLSISTPYAAFFVTSVSVSAFSPSVRLSFITWNAGPATPFSFGVTMALPAVNTSSSVCQSLP